MGYVRILGTGGYVPEKIISNADLEKMVDTSDQWIFERTGIRKRHIASENDSTVTMAEIAAREALDAANIDKTKIGMIIVATSTPDQLIPNTASAVQTRLGLSETECPAFDISVACAGFIYGLSIASQYIKNGSVDYALVIGSESITRLVNWKDRSTCILFGDGAGAVVLGKDTKPGIYSTHLHVNGDYRDLLGLSGNLYDPQKKGPCYIEMRGNEVFKIAVTKLGGIVDETLAYNKLDKTAINWLVPHQANLRIIQATAKKLNIPMERVILTIEDQGNTSAASIPLALNVGVRDGRIKRDDLMLLESFGAGLAWGAALIRY